MTSLCSLNLAISSSITPMFPLHSRLVVAMFHSSLLNIMLCMCTTLYFMLVLACREIPWSSILLVARCCQNGKNPKAFCLLLGYLPGSERSCSHFFIYFPKV